MTTTTSAATAAALEENWSRWHAAREVELVAEYGWLSLRALRWLGDEPAVVADLPGRWSAKDGDAVLEAVVGDGLTVDGRLVDGRVSTHLADGGSLGWVRHGRRLVELVRRAGRYAIRLRDPDAPARTGFRGVPAYPVDERWVLTGRVTRLPQPEPVEVATARPDLRQVVTVVAGIDLDLDGTKYRLRATDAGDGRLALAFHDATNGHGTARWRTVVTDPVGADGRADLVRVDLNRAVNPPFAFSDHGTCPAPPSGNRLGAAVTAGEQAPVRVG